jgi:hypothetical protein
MAWNLKNLNPPARFHYNDTEEWIELRNVSIAEVRKIQKETTQKRVDYFAPEKGKPHRFEFEEKDEDKLFELLWDTQIVAWNLLDDKGNKIPCNKKNKLLLMGNSTEFSTWVVDCLNQLAKDELEKKENEEKN